MLDELKKVVEIFAYLAAAGFFLFKWISGYMSTNLSIEIACIRKQATTDADFIAITVDLSKGDRGSLHIFDVGIRVDGREGNVRDQLEPYRVVRGDSTREKRRTIDWSTKDKTYYPFLQAGEKAQLSWNCTVASKGISKVEVVVVGRRKFSQRVKQWRASAVSLPL
jgi:hypothetical protein